MTTRSRWSSPTTSTAATAASSSIPTHRSWAGLSVSGSGASPRATTSSSRGPAPASGTTTRSSSTPPRRGATQITPYVDGVPVSYTKLDSGTGGGPFANAALNFMSRAGTSLFGGGTLDEVAVYNRALSAATIAEHYASSGTNRRPVAALTLSQTSVKVNKTVTFRANGSTDPDGSIVRYQWDTRRERLVRDRHGRDLLDVTRSYSTTGDRSHQRAGDGQHAAVRTWTRRRCSSATTPHGELHDQRRTRQSSGRR